jgi:hypothetical protein
MDLMGAVFALIVLLVCYAVVTTWLIWHVWRL